MAEQLSPIRRQYLEVKRRYPHAIVFFRMGDFYETFDEDAKVAARELDIALTSKPMGKNLRVPLAGVPHHSLDGHVGRLLSRGYKVAICEQLEDPRAAKGLVARDVVRLVTPGTITEDSLLSQTRGNYLVAIVPGETAWGLAYVDVTTGEFAACEVSGEELRAELERLGPAEVLIPEGARRPVEAPAYTQLPEVEFDTAAAQRLLQDHFGVATLEGFGCVGLPLATACAGVLLDYVRQAQRAALGHLRALKVYRTDQWMAIDAAALRNLEILDRVDGAPTLAAVMDGACTRMGSRLLRTWLVRPLIEPAAIDARLDRVADLKVDPMTLDALQSLLRRACDLERLAVKASAGTALPRDLAAVRTTLQLLPDLEAVVPNAHPIGAQRHVELLAVLVQALTDDPPPLLGQGGAIREGFSEELDGLRALASDTRRVLVELETREREASGIRTLKLGYNRVFGYYLEVSAANTHLVPGRLAAAADADRGRALHNSRAKRPGGADPLRPRACRAAGAGALSRSRGDRREPTPLHCWRRLPRWQSLTSLAGFARLALDRDYARPVIDDSRAIELSEARHPVVETVSEQPFVGNDLALDSEGQQIVLLTGPNMAGKSTYLRQAGLIVVMAQCGSFVPAREARIGIVDRLFTPASALTMTWRPESPPSWWRWWRPP